MTEIPDNPHRTHEVTYTHSLIDRWMPIEMAPKDGTEFLAYDIVAKKMDVCAYTDFCGVSQVQMDGEYGPDNDEFGYSWENIKFWMPLPVPPQDAP